MQSCLFSTASFDISDAPNNSCISTAKPVPQQTFRAPAKNSQQSKKSSP